MGCKIKLTENLIPGIKRLQIKNSIPHVSIHDFDPTIEEAIDFYEKTGVVPYGTTWRSGTILDERDNIYWMFIDLKTLEKSFYK